MVKLPNKTPAPAAPPQASYYTVRASFLAALVARFESQGRSAQPLLNQIGISTAQLADSYGSIPLPQFVAFLESAAATVKDENLGARMGTTIKAGDMGPVGLALSLSRTISDGMDRMARFVNALQGGTESQWGRTDDTFIYSYRISQSGIWPRRQDAEFSISSLIQVIRDNFTGRFAPMEVHFEHAPPANPLELERMFRAPVRYLQPINRLLVDKDTALKPLRKEDPELISTLERHVQDTIGHTPLSATIRDATSTVIQTNLGLSAITLERVAAALQLSPRTLQRRLASEGSSLRAELESVRKDRAIRLLAQPGARVGEVAQALGYGDATAFWRAYRGWTGHAPTDHPAS